MTEGSNKPIVFHKVLYSADGVTSEQPLVMDAM